MKTLPQWHLIPIRADDKNPGSLLGKDWHLKASCDPKQIEQWQEQYWGAFNWGLLLGEKSGVVDIEADTEEGNRTLDELCSEVVTVSYRSAKSTHRLFRWDPRFANLKAAVTIQGIEFRLGSGNASQSVIPPSRHPSGAYYKWIHPPDEVELAEVPECLLAILFSGEQSAERKKDHTPVLHDDRSETGGYAEQHTAEHPGTDFSQRGLSVLLDEMRQAGYTVRSKGDYYEFDRPGKQSSNSHSGHVGKRSNSGNFQLTSWSQNDPFFPTGETISIFQAFALLRCGGDLKEAAKQLRVKGYGSQLQAEDAIDYDRLWNSFDQKQSEEVTTSSAASPTTKAVMLLDEYAHRLDQGISQPLFNVGDALESFEIGPELLTILGAPPGFGKTTLAMQATFEAIRRQDRLRVVVANAETSFAGLLRREVCRLTGVDGGRLRFNQLSTLEKGQVNRALGQLRQQLGAMEVLEEPNTLKQIAKLRSSEPGLLIVDYLQKFAPSGQDPKAGISALMHELRALAREGWGVLCLSATRRPSSNPKDPQDVSQHVFRDSSEIEFNADSCYVMRDDGTVGDDEQDRYITLVHSKNRHGAKRDIGLRFDMRACCFHQVRMSTLRSSKIRSDRR